MVGPWSWGITSWKRESCDQRRWKLPKKNFFCQFSGNGDTNVHIKKILAWWILFQAARLLVHLLAAETKFFEFPEDEKLNGIISAIFHRGWKVKKWAKIFLEENEKQTFFFQEENWKTTAELNQSIYKKFSTCRYFQSFLGGSAGF